MTGILSFLSIFLGGIAVVLYINRKRKNNIKNRFYGIKVGVVIMKSRTNNKDTFFEGFIQREFISKGAKITPIILHSLKKLSEIENLKEITLYQEKFDFLVAGELKTESKIKRISAPHSNSNKNISQKIIYLPNLLHTENNFATIVKYTLNFKIFSFASRSYVGESCIIDSKFLNDSIQPVFGKMAKNLVDVICVAREGYNQKGKVLIEVKNNYNTGKNNSPENNKKDERTQK